MKGFLLVILMVLNMQILKAQCADLFGAFAVRFAESLANGAFINNPNYNHPKKTDHQKTQKQSILSKEQISSIEINYDKAIAMEKDVKIPIAIKIKTIDNKILFTKGYGNGEVDWSEILITVKGATFSAGEIQISSDYKGKKIKIKAKLYADIDIFDNLIIFLKN